MIHILAMTACWQRFVELIWMEKELSLILKELLWCLKVMDSLKKQDFMLM